MELKETDDTIHEVNDEYETPTWLFTQLIEEHKIFPKLDMACNDDNCKCLHGTQVDALQYDWIWHGDILDIWCNPPHSKTEDFVKRADVQFRKYNMNILMIVPANAICSHYFDEIFSSGRATYHRIPGGISFKQNGKKTGNSRNRYFSIVWKAKPSVSNYPPGELVMTDHAN